MASGRVVLLWLRNDLRLLDNPLLHHPSVREAPAVLPVLCLDPRHFGPNAALHPRWSKAPALMKTGVLRARFLLEAAQDLQRSLRQLGSDLLLVRGRPEDILPKLAGALGAQAGGPVQVLTQKEVADEEVQCELAVQEALEGLGASLERLWGAQTLFQPEDLPFELTKLPEPFTMFRNVVESKKTPVPVRDELPIPASLPPPPSDAKNICTDEADLATGIDEVLAALGFSVADIQRRVDGRCSNSFVGGESAALLRLEAFAEAGLGTYKQTRDSLMGENFSSKLSPWMANGSLSPRTVYWRVARFEEQYGESLDTYWLGFELKWRDFFRFFGVKHGKNIFLRGGPVKSAKSWSTDEELFERWCTGNTGIPFVDANMRELALTGFMSNRGRQCVASFLTQDLQLDWRLGAQWFEQTLLDHDVCSNYGNWVCAAGVGMRGQRINKFNMAKQAQTYDKQAQFVQLWLPELANFPPQLALSPWDASSAEQKAAGCIIGEDYAESVAKPKWAPDQAWDKQRTAGEEKLKSGFSLEKRRWHHGRNGAYLAS